MEDMIELLLQGTGAVALVVGLSAWLGRVWASRILEKDRVRYESQMESLLVELRTKGEQEVFVHKLQFEKEFQVYSELWKELLRLARALNQFRVLTLDNGRSHDEKMQDVANSVKAFNDRVYDHRPFYSPEIYNLAKSVLDKAWSFRGVRDGRPTLKDEEGFEQAMQSINDDLVPLLCNAIRKRIFSKQISENA